MKKDEKAGQYRMGRADVLAMLAVVLAAALIFTGFLPRKSHGNARAQVRQNGKLIAELPLDTPRELTVEGAYQNTVTVRGGKVAITASDCPGEDCVRCGWISAPGKSLVCLPNGLEVRVIARTADVDFVVG